MRNTRGKLTYALADLVSRIRDDMLRPLVDSLEDTEKRLIRASHKAQR